MKKILLIILALFVLGIGGLLLATKFIGPRIISVSAPTGQPIGEFDTPRPETSLFAVDIAIPLSMLAETANAQAPERLQGQEQKNFHKRVKDGGYAYDIVRGKIEFQNQGNGLAFGAAIEGAAVISGKIDAKILTIPVNSRVELGGLVGGKLSPVIEPNWQVNPNLIPYLQLSKANLNIGGLGGIDISELLSGSLSGFVQREAQKLTPALKNRFDLRSEVSELWAQAFLSEQVSDDPPVWLNVDPKLILLSPIDYSIPEQLGVTVAIQSETFLTNREPQAIAKIALPNLQPIPEPVPTDLKVPIVVSMAELNEVLAKEDIDIDTGFGTSIEISNLEAEVGQEGLMNLKLAIKAENSSFGRGIAGDIWVKGRPLIDYEKQTLGFSDVDLTVETRDKLTSSAAWLLDELLVKGIESQIRVDLNDYKEELDEEVQKAIQSADLPEGIDVSLEDLEVTLADIYTITRHHEAGPVDPGIVIVVRATGDVNTRISQLKKKDP